MILSEVAWPIYPVKNNRGIKVEDGLTLLLPELSDTYQVLDTDKSNGSTLGSRRLKYELAPDPKPFKLSKLHAPIHRYADIFYFLKKYTTFIDSTGRIFNYNYSARADLKYYEILKFREVSEGYVIILKDKTINCPFFINREPTLEDKYAGILHIGMGRVLFDIVPERLKDTWKAI